MIDKKYFNGHFGLERETLRVDVDGKLAQTPHPFEDEHLSRDFCENQLEIITPVFDSIDGAVDGLKQLSDKARKILSEKNEYLWLYSNPPRIADESEIPIAEYSGAESGKRNYRLKLEQRYGKRLMLYSGIHFNLSFDESLFAGREEQTAFYMKLLRQATRYSWLLVLLTAASPLYDRSLDADGESGTVLSESASMRNSSRGYWNSFVPLLDYTDLKSYCDSIRFYVNKGLLFSESELYCPIRIKPRGENSLDGLEKGGIDHIELRMFDLNILSPNGIFTEDLEFAYNMLIYLAQLEDFDFTPKMQEQAFANHKNASAFDLENVLIDGQSIETQALDFLNRMSHAFEGYDRVQEVIAYQKSKLENRQRYATIITEKYRNCFAEGILKTIQSL